MAKLPIVLVSKSGKRYFVVNGRKVYIESKMTKKEIIAIYRLLLKKALKKKRRKPTVTTRKKRKVGHDKPFMSMIDPSNRVTVSGKDSGDKDMINKLINDNKKLADDLLNLKTLPVPPAPQNIIVDNTNQGRINRLMNNEDFNYLAPYLFNNSFTRGGPIVEDISPIIHPTPSQNIFLNQVDDDYDKGDNDDHNEDEEANKAISEDLVSQIKEASKQSEVIKQHFDDVSQIDDDIDQYAEAKKQKDEADRKKNELDEQLRKKNEMEEQLRRNQELDIQTKNINLNAQIFLPPQENKAENEIVDPHIKNHKMTKQEAAFYGHWLKANGLKPSDNNKERYLREVVFKPGNGLSNKSGGLYDDEIERIMSRFKDFKGCIMRDQIKTLLPHIAPQSRLAFIINTDPSDKPGRHWCGVYIDSRTGPESSNSVEWYDSFARPCPPDIREDLKLILKCLKPETILKMKENGVLHQKDSSTNCGWFCCSFLIDRFRGKTFSASTGYDDQVKLDDRKYQENKIEKLKNKAPFNYILHD